MFEFAACRCGGGEIAQRLLVERQGVRADVGVQCGEERRRVLAQRRGPVGSDLYHSRQPGLRLLHSVQAAQLDLIAAYVELRSPLLEVTRGMLERSGEVQ
jgi:hypothetical protein